MKKIIYLSLLLSFYSHFIFSQSETGETLEDVIIFSDNLQIPFKKQNRNIQVLSAATIRQIPAASVNELLLYISGVDVRQKGPNGTQADVGIDGGTFDQTLVLVNGIKMSDPQTGHNMMNLPIPLDAIERIEVLRGPAARIYGVNALMGVINIVTKSKSNELIAGVYAGTSFKQNDSTGNTYFSYGISAAKNFSTDKANHLLSASLDKGNGYRYNTAFQNIKVLYAGDAKLSSQSEVQWTAGIVDNDFGASYFYASPRDKEGAEHVRSMVAGIKAPIQINKSWKLKPYINYKHGYDHYVFVRQNPSVYENIHNTQVWDGGLDNIITTDWGTFNIGVNVRSESINSTNLGKRDRMNYGAFLEYQKFWNHFDVNAGIYFNQNSVFGFDMYPGIDLGYAIDDKWRMYFNAGMGQRLPTFTDLYYSDPNSIGNDKLVPEYMTSYELGTKYQTGNARFNAAVFYKNGRNFIDWVRADTTLPWQVQNFTSLNTLGMTIDYAQDVRVSNNMLLNINAGYTYLDPQIGEPIDGNPSGLTSRYAINALQHQFVLRAAAILYDNFTVSIGNRYIKRLDTPKEMNGYSAANYNLLDMKLSYRFHHWTVYGEVSNLFNVQYIQSGVVPMPGSWFTLGAKYKM